MIGEACEDTGRGVYQSSILNIEKDTYRQESTSWLFDIPADLCLLLPSSGWCPLKAHEIKVLIKYKHIISEILQLL